MAFGDVNNDGYSDVFQNFGGHAPWDRKSGIDSREKAALFVRNPAANVNTAVLLLEGVSGNRDAIGARLKVSAEETHYYTVRSTQAFQSQNDPRLILSLGNAASGQVEITWPGGATSTVSINAGDRIKLTEDGAVSPL